MARIEEPAYGLTQYAKDTVTIPYGKKWCVIEKEETMTLTTEQRTRHYAAILTCLRIHVEYGTDLELLALLRVMSIPTVEIAKNAMSMPESDWELEKIRRSIADGVKG